MTHDMWYVTGGGSFLALPVWEWRCLEDISTKDDWLKSRFILPLQSGDQVKLYKFNINFSNYFFVSCPKLSKTTECIFKEGFYAICFWKPKMKRKNLIWKPRLEMRGLPCGKFWPLSTLWRNSFMFLDILHLEKRKKMCKKNCFQNVVSVCVKMVYVSTKLF